MQTYSVELTGKTPLLMHRDNIEWADYMDAWKNDPENKNVGKAGDDRSPPWRWLGCCYHDGTDLCLPQENIMRALMEGGAMVLVPGGKRGKTFKAQTQSGMMTVEPFWQLTINKGATVKWKELVALNGLAEFPEHLVRVRDMGFDLLVKRAKVNSTKHIRVRPMFLSWQAIGQLAVWDPQLNEKALAQILAMAGQYKGIGDWRPGGKTPGPYGTFEATLKKQ